MDNNKEILNVNNEQLNITDDDVVESVAEAEAEQEADEVVEAEQEAEEADEVVEAEQEAEEADEVVEAEQEAEEAVEVLEADNLELSLGQVIKIISPDNADYHEKNFFIYYIDEDKINIYELETEEAFTLNKENNSLTDESIEEIEIIYEPEEKGYARQNGLLPGYNITIEFGGSVPTILNGEITNLEEDMIEVSLYNSTEKIYIDFAYKGIPEKLNIVSIKEFVLPEEKSKILDAIDTSKKYSQEILEDPDDIIYDEDDMDDIEHDYNEKEIQLLQENELLEANNVVIDDENFMIIQEEYTVSEENRRYNFDKQTEDLLDNMLGKLSSEERTRSVVEEINKNIIRFKELRHKYSEFEVDGIVQRPKYKYTKNKNFKPLTEMLKNQHRNLHWILPVIKQNKTLCDVDLLAVGETKNEDYRVETFDSYIESYNSVYKRYRNNDIPNDANKFKYFIENISRIQSNLEFTPDKRNVISSIPVQTQIKCVINNYGEYNSSVVKNENVTGFKNYQQILLPERKYTVKDNETNVDVQKQLVPSDKLNITGFIVLPFAYQLQSKMFLPNQTVREKNVLQSIYQDIENINKYNLQHYVIGESFNKQKLSLVNEYPYSVEFNETLSFEDRNTMDTLDKFLDAAIIDNNTILKQLNVNIKKTTDIYNYLKEVETYGITFDTLNHEHTELINKYIEKNINEFLKTLATRENSYLRINSSEKNESYLVENTLGENDEIKQLIQANYELENTHSSTEQLNKILKIDGGSLLTSAIIKTSDQPVDNINFNKVINEEMRKMDILQQESEGIGECKQFVIAKKYTNIHELTMDNNRETYFDLNYDNTRYDIMENFEQDKGIIKDEILIKKIKEHLIKNVGVNEKDAERDAFTMFEGRKLVVEGDYAILDLGDFEYRYYERINNMWQLNPEFNDKMPDDAIFCNLREKCLKINEGCSNIEKAKIQLEKDTLKKIANQFSEDIENNHTQKKQQIIKNFNNHLSKQLETKEYLKKLKLKKNNKMLLIAEQLEDFDFIVSPYAELRDTILSQTDIYKKYEDLNLFIEKYCREKQPMSNESNFWYYCIDTDAPLLPTFFYKLAIALQNGNYSIVLDEIVKSRGKLSGDGSKIVDLHSGYTIKQINFDTDEGFNADGYRNESRAVLEKDIGDVLASTLGDSIDESSFSKQGIIIVKTIIAILTDMGLNLDKYLHEMTSLVLKVINDHFIKPKEYNQKSIIKKKKGKTVLDYNHYFYIELMKTIISVIVIFVQSAKPSIKKAKTFPGCVVSLAGFPLEENNNKKNILNYVVCIVLKKKNDTGVFKYGRPRIVNLRSKNDILKKDRYIQQIVEFMKTNVLTYPEIEKKLQDKRDWILSQTTTNKEIDERFSLERWSTFLPPMKKLKGLNNERISDSYKTLLNKFIVSGNKNVFKTINVCYKIQKSLSFSLYQEVNKIISNKELLFITSGGVPYLENACCNDANGNVYEYFLKNNQSNKIKNLNENVGLAMEVLNKINNLTSPNILFSDANTKNPPTIANNEITEETIYMAFIKYCKYNTGLTLDDELASICKKNTAPFNKFDLIQDKIDILKSENGDLYDKMSFNRLMRIINKRNSVSLDINADVIDNLQIFKKLLEKEVQKDDDILNVKEVFSSILNHISFVEKKRYIKSNDENKETKATKYTDKIEDIIFAIETAYENKKENVEKFLKFHNSNSRKVKKYISVIEKINKFNENGDNLYFTKKDNTNHYVAEFIKNMLYTLCVVLPEIIINGVDYENMYVPKHWNLGNKFHINDIMNIISTEYSEVKKFFGNNEFVDFLKNIKTKLLNIYLISKYIPFIPDQLFGKTKHSTFNSKILVSILKLLYITSLETFVKEIKSFEETGFLEDINITESEKIFLQEVKQNSSMENIKQKVNELLKIAISMTSKKKKNLNLSKEKIKKTVLKSKVKEKNRITDKLRNMTEEQRRIENLKKNHRLGDWSVGLSRAIYEYDENQYDKEREEMEKIALEEMELGISDDITDEQRNIYMMEHLENKAIAMREEREAYALDMRDEGERDGEELW